MQPRRSLRLVAGALVLAMPLLGACGFDKATDRVYTPAAGTNSLDGDLKVLGAVIVSAQPGSGTVVASLSNQQTDEKAQLTGVTGAGEWTDLKITPADLTVDLEPEGFANLVDEDPITVTGDFTPGDVAELSFTFDGGQIVTMDVPIVYDCNAYAGLDPSVEDASEAPSATTSPSPGDVPTDGTTASPSADDSESPSASASAGAPAEPYDCTAVGEG